MDLVPPSVRKTAFNCPHCGALAHQSWYSTRALKLSNNKTPIIVEENSVEEYLERIEDKRKRDRVRILFDKAIAGKPVIESKSDSFYSNDLINLHVSECFNCNDLSVWIHDRLVYPQRGEVPPANPDLPDDIRRDYDEAGNILDSSPRGAAALLRLAIQKLCIELGQPGENLNEDIGALVQSGLDVQIQKALDVVRVIGNEAVHPGQIDLADDRDTAESLFGLVNVITEKMISVPKHIDNLYKSLPETKREQIEKRDTPDPQKDG